MLDYIALMVILLSGVYFVGLGVFSVAKPVRATRFLESFAGSAFAHYLEMTLRMAVGLAFVRYGQKMPFAEAFTVFGWLLVVTTVCLILIPWRWHHKFAQKSIPHVIRHLKLFAATSFVLGIFVLACSICAAIFQC